MTAFKKRVLDKIAQKRNYTDWEELKKDYAECDEDYRCHLIEETTNTTLAEVEKEIEKLFKESRDLDTESDKDLTVFQKRIYKKITLPTVRITLEELKNRLRGKEQ